MNLTNQELDLLRSQPHKTDLYLSIYRPNTVMTARVTGTYSTGDTTISFYSASGDYTDLYPDLTVMVGTVPNSDDIGRIRMRAASGTYFVAAENGITWQTGNYLTFLDYIDIQAIYPKIIQDPSNQENVIFYKDGNIPYSNQNTIYGTFPNAGPHRALFLESGTATSYYTATGTYNVTSSALTYSWAFQGGTPTGSTAITPGNVTYSSPGHYKTRLIVTAANGAVDTTYRYVSVYHRPGAGSSTPTLRWEFLSFQGSRSEGGYTASFKVYENIGDVQPNALVVIFADTWYGGTKVNVGGNAQGNQSIVFVGYILEDTIRFDWEKSSVEFQVGSVSEVMKETEGFSVSCESKASPATWFELQEMNVQKAVYHYLKWHSTVLRVTDFQYISEDRLVQYFDADRGSLYDAIDSFLRDGMLGSLISDRQGKLWGEISPFGLETPFTTIPNYFTIHKRDWMGSPTIRERRNSELSLIELGGIAFYGVASNAFSALISNAPSTAPLYYGKSDRKEGLILNSQQQLNRIAGNYLANFNTEFPDISMSLNGFYNNFDIAPLERLFLTISQDDSVASRSLQHLPYIVESMEFSYNPKNQSFLPDITLNQIATGTAGVTVLIPAVSPDEGYTIPSLDLPPLPNFGNTTPPGPSAPMSVLFHDTGLGLVYTEDFDGSNPQYYTVNGGLPDFRYQAIESFFICPNGAVYVCIHRGANEGGFVARAPALGQPFTVIYNSEFSPGDLENIHAIGYRPDAPETVGIVLKYRSNPVSQLYIGNGVSGFAAGAIVATGNNNFSGALSYRSVSGGYWLYTSYSRYAKVNAAGGTVLSSGDPSWKNRHYIGGPAYNRTIVGLGDDTGWAVTDFGSLQSSNILDGDLRTAGMAGGISPDGLLLMARYEDSKYKSSDGGSTWLPLPNLPPGNYYFGYAGTGGSVTSTRWIAAGSVIRFSPDFGNTWLNREGNYTSLAVPQIDAIFVPGVTSRDAFTEYG